MDNSSFARLNRMEKHHFLDSHAGTLEADQIEAVIEFGDSRFMLHLFITREKLTVTQAHYIMRILVEDAGYRSEMAVQHKDDRDRVLLHYYSSVLDANYAINVTKNQVAPIVRQFEEIHAHGDDEDMRKHVWSNPSMPFSAIKSALKKRNPDVFHAYIPLAALQEQMQIKDWAFPVREQFRWALLENYLKHPDLKGEELDKWYTFITDVFTKFAMFDEETIGIERNPNLEEWMVDGLLSLGVGAVDTALSSNRSMPEARYRKLFNLALQGLGPHQSKDSVAISSSMLTELARSSFLTEAEYHAVSEMNRMYLGTENYEDLHTGQGESFYTSAILNERLPLGARVHALETVQTALSSRYLSHLFFVTDAEVLRAIAEKELDVRSLKGVQSALTMAVKSASIHTYYNSDVTAWVLALQIHTLTSIDAVKNMLQAHAVRYESTELSDVILEHLNALDDFFFARKPLPHYASDICGLRV